MNKLVKKAYAKVNLALDVIRKREDGYHDVCMIMQNLDLYDTLTFTVENINTPQKTCSSEANSDNQPQITITTNKEGIPTDERNLIYKAIQLMFDKYDIKAKIHVNLEKNIPVEAGMAGGSTDCAATLHAVNELFNLNLDTQTLMELGVKLGADVPFCVLAKTALSEGIGEVLTPITGLFNCYVLVVKPPIGVSTATVYKNLKINELDHHPDVPGMAVALTLGDLEQISSRMENVLESVTVNLHPEIEQLKTIMKENGALNAIMSGSGPTVFGLFTSKELAENAASVIRERTSYKEIFVTTPIN